MDLILLEFAKGASGNISDAMLPLKINTTFKISNKTNWFALFRGLSNNILA